LPTTSPQVEDVDRIAAMANPVIRNLEITAGGTACAATDWCDLAQRMHYIVHLFRAYAEDSTLFSRPFTPGQVAAFRAGLVPGGAL